MKSQTISSSLLLFASTLTGVTYALPPTNFAPPSYQSRAACRCISVAASTPPHYAYSFTAETPRSRNWHCAELGSKLEFWRKANRDEFQHAWNEVFASEADDLAKIIVPSSPTEGERKPIPTTVLMDIAASGRGPEGEGKIICRDREEMKASKGDGAEDEEFAWSDHGIMMLGFFLILLAVGCLVEMVEAVVSRVRSFRIRQPVFLEGAEQDLSATPVDEKKSPWQMTRSLDREIYGRPVL